MIHCEDMFEACKKDCNECFLLFLKEEDCDPINQTSNYDNTALGIAIRCNSSKCLDIILNYISPSLKNELFTDLLFIAVGKNNADCLKILLKHGADPFSLNCNNSTLLHTSTLFDSKECLEILLNIPGMSKFMNIKNNRGNTPIEDAILNNSKECLKMLLNKLKNI